MRLTNEEIKNRTEERLMAQANLPAQERKAHHMIEAEVICGEEGHPFYVSGRCYRCKGRETTSTKDEATLQTPEVIPNPYQRNNPSEPCTLCQSYCYGDCAS